MTINTILFDLDGTLVDSAADLLYATNKVLAIYGHKEQKLADIKPFISQGVRGILTKSLGSIDEKTLKLYHKQVLDIYSKNINKYSRYFDGMAMVIAKIVQQNMQWGVVTNKPEKFTNLLLNALAIKPNIVISGDTLTHNKPHPEPLLYAVKSLKTTTDKCLFVGDDYTDALAARSANMKFVAVSYGYNIPEANWSSDHIIHTPSQLLEILDVYL